MTPRPLAAALLALVTGCDLVNPQTYNAPPNTTRFLPPPVYATWWSQIEACSGRSRAMSDVLFYVVPNAATFDYRGMTSLLGAYNAPQAILLADLSTDLAPIVRHEMLHALLPDAGPAHPPEYFVTRCGALVAQSEEVGK